jgi:hypothetical protein
MTNDNVTKSKARWGRRGLVTSLLAGAGTLALTSFSWLRLRPSDGGEYQVIAEWQILAGGKGLIIAISPDYGPEELRGLGRRFRDRFGRLENAVVMVFDDAVAARQVRRGSRTMTEAEFQAALVHQRAMYLRSSPRGEDSFTIYKAYPTVDEVIQYDDGNL